MLVDTKVFKSLYISPLDPLTLYIDYPSNRCAPDQRTKQDLGRDSFSKDHNAEIPQEHFSFLFRKLLGLLLSLKHPLFLITVSSNTLHSPSQWHLNPKL